MQLLLLLEDGLRSARPDCRGRRLLQLGRHTRGSTLRLFLRTGYDDSTASRHLEDIVAVMGHRHELGQGWIPEDGVVWQVDVGDVEVNDSVR